MTTPKTLATIDGTMLTPGVSRNNRLYTKEAIGRAVARMRERLADPTGLPIVMRTHHDAGDDSRRIVGRITDVTQLPDGAASYKARLFDTVAGRDIGALIDPDAPALKSTSIHGYWIGPVEQHRQGAAMVETGTDLEVDAIDFTATPGVVGAQIRSVAFESVASRKQDRAGITETAEATVTLTTEVDEVEDRPNPILEKYSAGQRKTMAARGAAMKDGSYPIANKGDLRKAIRAVGRGNADHDTIRAHIIARAKTLGFSAMIPPDWGSDGSTKETADRAAHDPGPEPAPVVEAHVEVSVGDETGLLARVTVMDVEPNEIKKTTRAAAKAAARALNKAPTPDVPVPDAAPDDTSGLDPYETHTRTRETSTVPTWTVNVNGVALDADEAKTIVAQALVETQPLPPAPADPTPTPAPAPEPAPVEETTKEVAVSDETKAVEPATTPAELTAVLVKAFAESVPAMVAAAVRQELTAAKAEETAARAVAVEAAKTTETTTAPAEAAVAESTTKASTPTEPAQVTETTPGVTKAELQELLAQTRRDTITEMRAALLKEGGLPTRRGYRHVLETADGKPLEGEALWEQRSQVWDGFFPTQPIPTPIVSALTTPGNTPAVADTPTEPAAAAA